MPRKTNPAAQDASDIGYKRTPKHTRFKPGQSGNPSGKRKAKPPKSEPERLDLSETITLTLQGKRVTMSRRKALHEKLFAMAIGGNLRAIELLFKLDALNDNRPGQTEGSGSEVSESEEVLIARFLQRHADGEDGAKGGGDE
jgi:hypothetical protein